MKKTITIIVGIVLAIIILIALAGMYKFNYLANQPGYDADGNKVQENLQVDYINLTVVDAQKLAQSNGDAFRIVVEDGETQPTTRDFRLGRINATVEKGIVVSYIIEGEELDEELEETKVDYTGLTVEEAVAQAEENDIPFRIVMEDGEALPATLDYRIGRINATVEDGIVVSYDVEGK